MGLNIYYFLISQNIYADLKEPKEKYINCTMDYIVGFPTLRLKWNISLVPITPVWIEPRRKKTNNVDSDQVWHNEAV